MHTWILILAVVAVAAAEEEEAKMDSKFSEEQPKYTFTPSEAPMIIFPYEFSISFGMVEPYNFSITIDTSFTKSLFKLHFSSALFSFVNSTLFDLKNHHLYGRLPFMGNLCKYYQINESYNIPNLSPFLNSWQMLAKYKGIYNDSHVFQFPNLISEKNQALLFFDKATLALKKVEALSSKIGIQIIDFHEISSKNPEVFGFDKEGCTLLTEEELNKYKDMITSAVQQAMDKKLNKLPF